MADLRSTANDFKSTWEKEVDLEEETKAFQIDNLLNEEEDKPVPRETAILPDAADEPSTIEVPAIKAMNKEEFEAMAAAKEEKSNNGHHADTETKIETEPEDEPDLLSDKRNWL